MIKNYKNYLYSNIIAISGYPVLWCIYWFIFCIMNPVGGGDIIGFILIPFSTIYCLVVLAITLCVFIIELILKKSNRQIKLYAISNNIFYNIYLHIGLALFFILLIPLLLFFIAFFMNELA